MINEIKPNPTLFFTSDHHFGHANVIRFDNESFGKVARPYADVYEMNEDMISKWNSEVSENDIVFHLGDIFWRTMNVKDARNI
jgi:calcineurin-like phosphoesterase family protein